MFTFKLDRGQHHYRLMMHDCAEFDFALHDHENVCDLTFVFEGVLEQQVNDRPIRYDKGSLILIRERDRHELHGHNMVMFNMNLSQAMLATMAAAMYQAPAFAKLIEQPMPPVARMSDEQAARLRSALEFLFRHMWDPEHEIGFHRFVLTTLIDFLLPLVRQQNRDDEPPAWFKACLTAIDQQLEDLALADLPRLCDRSREHISRSFRQFMGQSPSAYIMEKRLERAAILTAHTSRPILDICYSLQFNSVSYFYRKFKEKYQLAPNQYRKANGWPGVETANHRT